MLTITKIFTFEAAHHLPDHNGKCRKIHGHTYTLEVTIQGEKQNAVKYKSDSGMVMDFHDLSKIVNDNIIGKYDHSYLNDFFEVPTAESMIEEFAREIEELLPPSVKLKRLHLWEGKNSYVEWKPDKE